MLPWGTDFVAPDGTGLPAFSGRLYDVAGAMAIYGNQAVGTDPGAITMAAVQDITTPPDQVVQGIVGGLGGVSYVGLAVRAGAPGSGNGYWWLGTLGFAEFGVLAAGVFAVLGVTGNFVGGDALMIQAQGASLRCYINGALDSTFVDGTYPAGMGGLCGFRDDHVSGLLSLRVSSLFPAPAFMPSFVPGV